MRQMDFAQEHDQTFQVGCQICAIFGFLFASHFKVFNLLERVVCPMFFSDQFFTFSTRVDWIAS
ncbi:hypothetical protein DDT91_19770, partial [Algoriphagus sp. AK58]|nr:hypothetical protein [Algoriphagus sp. AK58]